MDRAKVNIHGNTDRDKLREATIKFLKAVEKHRAIHKEKQNEHKNF